MRRARQIPCPFCKESVPAPRQVTTVFTPGGCLAERCSCGAVYAVDETGRLGGQALLDAQAVLCEGDLRLAMTLETGKKIWESSIKGDIISSPVVSNGSVYATTFDGTVYRFKDRLSHD